MTYPAYLTDKRGTLKQVAAMLESTVRRLPDALEPQCKALRLST